MEVGAVDGGVASGGPAGAHGEESLVIDLADPDFAGGGLHLGVAFEAEVGIALGEHLAVDGAVGCVAGDAALAIGLVLEDKGTRLFPVALRALLIESGHPQAAGSLEDLAAVRVMALDAVHLAFHDGVMLWQTKLHVDILVAGEAGLRVLARIEDQIRSIARGFDVAAAGAVAALATGAAGKFVDIDIDTDAEVNVALEASGVVCVAVITLVIPDESGAGNVGGDDEGPRDRGAGTQETDPRGRECEKRAADRPTFPGCGCHGFRIRSRVFPPVRLRVKVETPGKAGFL